MPLSWSIRDDIARVMHNYFERMKYFKANMVCGETNMTNNYFADFLKTIEKDDRGLPKKFEKFLREFKVSISIKIERVPRENDGEE